MCRLERPAPPPPLGAGPGFSNSLQNVEDDSRKVVKMFKTNEKNNSVVEVLHTESAAEQST